MRRIGFFAVLLVLGYSFGFAQDNKKEDPLGALRALKPWEVPFIAPVVTDTLGAPDTLFLDLKKGEKEGEWVLHFHVFNDESLFALSFPVRHDSLMKFDSISLVGTRIDFFQTKMVNKPANVPNTVTVGLFSALNPMSPSLVPGRGVVLKMHFTAPASRPISVRSVGTISMPPGLEFVTPRGLGLHPAVVRLGDKGAGAPADKPVKPAENSKKKKG